MNKQIRAREEVENFLTEVKELSLCDELTIINSVVWANGRVNKTRQYMAETGIVKEDILKVIRQLDITNYSSTKEDRNVNFPDEYVWEFGISQSMIDHEENLYIKLKIREIDDKYLLIMSFHPEQPSKAEDKLMFPYRN